MPIQADEANIHQLFNHESIYRMPMFQRRYTWSTTAGEENGRRMWRDIDELLDEEVDKSFLGALVVRIEATGPLHPDDIEIIDGQQRITTLYVLLCAIVRYCEKIRETDLASTIANRYLVISSDPQHPNVPKIKPTVKDTEQFNRTIRELRTIENPSLAIDCGDGIRIRKMFNFHMKEIKSRCQPEGVHEQEKLDAIIHNVTQNLSFVLIQVPNEYDENKVFETLNDRGIPLTAADLVRNLIFSNVDGDPSVEEAVYNNHWLPLEDNLRYSDIDKMKEYFYPFGLSFDPSIKKNNLYRSLKENWRGFSAHDIIIDLKKHVPAYRALVFGPSSLEPEQFEHQELRTRIERFHRLRIPTSMYSFMLNLLTNSTSNSEIDECIKCMDIIESLLIRRSFLDIEPTGIHALFKGMWQSCGEKPDSRKMFEILENVAHFKFPSDDEFTGGVIGKSTNFYKRKTALYVCLEYETHLQDRGDRLPEMEDISREHVMPQTLPDEHDYIVSDDDHEEMVNSWANICLLTGQANSEISNSIWADKRTYYSEESVFKSTRKIARECETFGTKQLLHRANQLVNFSLDRWPRHY